MSGSGSDVDDTVVMDGPPPEGVDVGHPTEGPHGGELVELGSKEEYHAEILHGENSAGDPQTPTVYLLDGSATETVAIEAKELNLNTKIDDKPVSLTFVAKPTETDPEGKSSRFVCEAENAGEVMHHHGDASLAVRIDGKGFNGKLSGHDHSGHDHADH